MNIEVFAFQRVHIEGFLLYIPGHCRGDCNEVVELHWSSPVSVGNVSSACVVQKEIGIHRTASPHWNANIC